MADLETEKSTRTELERKHRALDNQCADMATKSNDFELKVSELEASKAKLQVRE